MHRLSFQSPGSRRKARKWKMQRKRQCQSTSLMTPGVLKSEEGTLHPSAQLSSLRLGRKEEVQSQGEYIAVSPWKVELQLTRLMRPSPFYQQGPEFISPTLVPGMMVNKPQHSGVHFLLESQREQVHRPLCQLDRHWTNTSKK